MNIGIVCYPTYGGSGVVATELGKAMADRGHKIHFITYNRPIRLDLFSENIFYHQVRTPNYPLFEFSPYESALASAMVEVARFNNFGCLPCPLCHSSCFGCLFGQANFEALRDQYPRDHYASWD